MIRVAVALLVLASACHRQKAATGSARVIECGADCPREGRDPENGGELRVHAETEPAGLCDLVNHEASVRAIIENQVMETLVEQDATGAIKPRLADHYATSDGALVFYLRHDIRFHDGDVLTSADVIFTLERARDPALGADQKSDLDPVGKIEAVGEYAVRLHLRGPAPFLLQALAHLVIYPKHLLSNVDLRTASFCRAPVGTGPFAFGSWHAGESVSIERNDSYWGPRAHLDRVDFRFVRDRQAALLLYLRGELDVLGRLPLHHDPLPAGHRVYRYTPRAMTFAVWNTRRPGLADPAVRASLGHAFDVPRFIATAFDGRAQPQSGPFVRGTPSYDDSIAPWPFEPQVVDGPKHLTFLATVGSVATEQLATMLEEDLRGRGITLTIEKLDFARVLERLRAHDFDVAGMSLSLALEQDNYGLFHSSAVDEQNWAGFKDAEVDALLEKIRGTDDSKARHALDRQLHAALHARGPMTFLVAPAQECAVAPGVFGVRPSSDGFDLVHAFRIAP